MDNLFCKFQWIKVIFEANRYNIVLYTLCMETEFLMLIDKYLQTIAEIVATTIF
jgi:hypothetical protein